MLLIAAGLFILGGTRLFFRTQAIGFVLFVIGAVAAVDPFDVAFDRFHRNETLLWREEGAQTVDHRGLDNLNI